MEMPNNLDHWKEFDARASGDIAEAETISHPSLKTNRRDPGAVTYGNRSGSGGENLDFQTGRAMEADYLNMRI
jgi:hypothetical protein